MRILLVDDEEIVCVPVCDELREAGHQVAWDGTAAAALERMQQEPFDVVITDLRMPGMDGLELLQTVKQEYPDTVVIMITAYATVANAVEAMRLGAYDYVMKPFRTDELLVILQRLHEHHALTEENQRLKAQLAERHSFHRIIGKSPAMLDIYRSLEIVCQCDCTVLVTGTTGTGKELVADAIHYNGTRKDGPLVKVSCAALSRDLLESELFGHVAGAFTGAVQDRQGRFEQADGGTIFLDEVDDIPLESQVKLLRVLESKAYERVGDGTTRKTDVRIVAATKQDLQELVAAGRFRDDLFYRLNVVPIDLPPLAQRREDIPLLVSHFLDQAGDASFEIPPETLELLMRYSWPGNVRELKNLIDRLAMVSRGKAIGVTDLPRGIREAAGEGNPHPGGSFEEKVHSLERQLILEALEKTNGNKTQAATLLEMTPSRFRYKLAALIDDENS